MKFTTLFLTIAICVAPQMVLAKPSTHKHGPHHAIAVRSHSSSVLTTAQRGNGFTNVSYANAYDAFGREILKHDIGAKETSESKRDGSFGYYVILKQRNVSGAEAKQLAAKYYEAFVSLRQRYFSAAEARVCSVNVKNSDEETVASEDQDELRLGP